MQAAETVSSCFEFSVAASLATETLILKLSLLKCPAKDHFRDIPRHTSRKLSEYANSSSERPRSVFLSNWHSRTGPSFISSKHTRGELKPDCIKTAMVARLSARVHSLNFSLYVVIRFRTCVLLDRIRLWRGSLHQGTSQNQLRHEVSWKQRTTHAAPF